MTAQAHLFGAAGRTDSAEVLAELEVDYTPVAVAVQLLLTLERDLGPAPRILDPSAGSGCWGRAARAVWPDCVLVGVEPRASEQANVAAAYTFAYHLDLAAFLLRHQEFKHGGFDLIISNPPFDVAFTKDYWPGLLLDAGLVAPGGRVALYGRSQWGQSIEAAANLRRWSPSWQRRLCGRPAHRADGRTDSCEYSLWGWDIEDLSLARSRPRPEWCCEQLPELPTKMRRWDSSAVPGTYPIEPAMVDEIRRRHL